MQGPNLMNLNTSSYDQDTTFHENSAQNHNSEDAIRERKRALIERSNQKFIIEQQNQLRHSLRRYHDLVVQRVAVCGTAVR